jgi:5-(carboxyamino)imidazole ribonucleotide synthase
MTVVGILGAGQLGRMIALAGYPLGLRFVVLDPSPDAPAGRLADHIRAPFDDRDALDDLAHRSHVVTYEFENVPVEAARRVERTRPVFPGPRALEAAQDRLFEKNLFRDLGIPTAPFEPVDDLAGLEAAARRIGLPAVLKTRREGYDGKGQRVIRRHEDLRQAFEDLGGKPLILEGFVPFERELSILAVRSTRGETRFWPLVQNTHGDGILRLSIAPAPDVPPELQAAAEKQATGVLDALGYVGVLAIELFQKDGVLYANEMAPRVHNSGHWTIEGAETSQFENHLRAGLGLPLGPTGPVGHSAMFNFIGDVPPVERLAAVPGLHLHLYDKGARPGRKIGHMTFRSPDPASRDAAIPRISAWLPGLGGSA